MKKKGTGQIKARKVAGGNKQRDFISKENTSSPTVATESVLLTSLVDAQENCDIPIVDIPNAVIQTNMENNDDKVVMRIRERAHGGCLWEGSAQSVWSVCINQEAR
jgi:hypothetical protein